jgi:hypothetical protein
MLQAKMDDKAAQITQSITSRLLDSQLMKDIEDTSNLSQLYNMPYK